MGMRIGMTIMTQMHKGGKWSKFGLKKTGNEAKRSSVLLLVLDENFA